MGTYLDLTGRFRRSGLLARTPPPERCLDTIQDWFTRSCGEMWPTFGRGRSEEGAPALGIGFHPAGEMVQVVALDGGRITVGAKTSTAGPGYHAYLCDALKRLAAEAKIDWDASDPAAGTGDPTGYFHTGDFDAVRREMLDWLGTVARQLLQMVDQDYTGLALSLPADVSFHHDGVVATPVGPVSRQWLSEVADAPGRGATVFPWYERGTGAGYHRGRALTRMWCDVRWRPPRDDAQREVLREVLTCLEKAHALDPSLKYPWREWQEVATLAGARVPEEVVPQAQAVPAGRSRIGYRRRDVTARVMDQWSLDVPGSFDTVINDDGSWQAFDDERVVYFSSLTVEPKPGNPPPPAEELLGFHEDAGTVLERFEHRGQRVIGRATFNQVGAEGKVYWQVNGLSAVPGKAGICTIDIHNRSQRDWALGVWKSIDRPID